MSFSTCQRLLCPLVLVLCCCSFSATFPFNMSEDGSGDEPEPELIFPTARATRVVPPSATPTPMPTSTPDLTTTFIRLKDFVISQVVDFLRDNLLLIIVVTSLLVVIVFIVCCASAMSHKRKLEAYYPPKKHQPRRYVTQPTKGAEKPRYSESRPNEVSGGVPVATYLRTPSSALVGEKDGRDPKPKAQEVVQKVEEVEEPREEPKKKKTKEEKEEEEAKPSTSAPVCTCHLRKASPPTK